LAHRIFWNIFVCCATSPDAEKITCGETGIISIQYHLFVKFINSIFQMLKKVNWETHCANNIGLTQTHCTVSYKQAIKSYIFSIAYFFLILWLFWYLRLSIRLKCVVKGLWMCSKLIKKINTYLETSTIYVYVVRSIHLCLTERQMASCRGTWWIGGVGGVADNGEVLCCWRTP
jgi:hypothetical protein